MMNAELVAADQSRIIIATVFRDDYLGGLRRLSRQDDASVLIKALRFAQILRNRSLSFAALTWATRGHDLREVDRQIARSGVPGEAMV